MYSFLLLTCLFFPDNSTTLEVDDLRESSVNLKEAVWMKDKDVSDCFQCEKPFSVARRKVCIPFILNMIFWICFINNLRSPSSASLSKLWTNLLWILL